MAREKIRAGYELVLEWLVCALMAALAVEVTLGVVYRTLGASLVWYDEVASILLAWLTFYGSALAAVKRAHIGCPELMALLPPAWRFPLTLLGEALFFAFFALLGWLGWSILEVLAADRLVSLPSVSVVWVQSVIPVSAALILLAEALNVPQILSESLSRHGAGTSVAAASREAAH